MVPPQPYSGMLPALECNLGRGCLQSRPLTGGGLGCRRARRLGGVFEWIGTRSVDARAEGEAFSLRHGGLGAAAERPGTEG